MRGFSGRARHAAKVAIGIPVYISRMPVMPLATSTLQCVSLGIQMDVHVPQAGDQELARGVDDAGAGRRAWMLLPNRSNASVGDGDGDILARWRARRVDDGGMLEERSSRRRFCDKATGRNAAKSEQPRSADYFDFVCFSFLIQLQVDGRDFASVEIAQPLVVAAHAVVLGLDLVIRIGPQAGKAIIAIRLGDEGTNLERARVFQLDYGRRPPACRRDRSPDPAGCEWWDRLCPCSSARAGAAAHATAKTATTIVREISCARNALHNELPPLLFRLGNQQQSCIDLLLALNLNLFASGLKPL